MCLLRINLPNLCPNMNHFDAVDFSECHSEEVISFFWRSMYIAWYYHLYVSYFMMISMDNLQDFHHSAPPFSFLFEHISNKINFLLQLCILIWSCMMCMLACLYLVSCLKEEKWYATELKKEVDRLKAGEESTLIVSSHFT